MNKSDVTIIIPVFERTDFFEEALESALNQTKEAEILVMDNGSSHNKFREICELKSKRIKYIKNEKNIGMFPNWNKGIENCSSKYFLILGDDDILDLDYVEKFYEILSKYPNIDIYYTDFNFFYNDNKKIIPSKWGMFTGYGTGLEYLKHNKKRDLNFPTISCIIKTELFKNNLFYDEFHASNDWNWLYKNIEKLEVYGNKKAKLRYRKHKESDTLKKESFLNTSYSHIAIRTYLFQIKSNKLRDLKFFLKSYFKALIFYSENLEYLEKQKLQEKYYYPILKKYYLDKKIFVFIGRMKLFKKSIKIFRNIKLGIKK